MTNIPKIYKSTDIKEYIPGQINKVGFKSSVNKFQIITTCSDYNGIKSEKTKRHKYSNLEI